MALINNHTSCIQINKNFLGHKTSYGQPNSYYGMCRLPTLQYNTSTFVNLLYEMAQYAKLAMAACYFSFKN